MKTKVCKSSNGVKEQIEFPSKKVAKEWLKETFCKYNRIEGVKAQTNCDFTSIYITKDGMENHYFLGI